MAREGNHFPVRVMRKILAGLKLFGASILSLFFVLPVHAQDVLRGLTQAGKEAYPSGPPTTDITGTISSLVTTTIGLIGVVFFLLLLYAGVLYMTSAGDEDKVGKAKKLIADAIIGMVIIFSAYALASFVESVLKTPPQAIPYTPPPTTVQDALGNAGNGNANDVLNELDRTLSDPFANIPTPPPKPPTVPTPPADITCDPDIDPNCDGDNPNNNPVDDFEWSFGN